MVTNAPGQSAFNEVERRMAPLSHELSVLPYNYYGNDLDESGKTIDHALELRNFQRPVWSQLKIDNHPVVSKYIKPLLDDAEVVNEPENLLWSSEHIRQSQYLLQIVR
ncbi:unnamed protein product, partial [Rotaria sp. Silwood2]